MDHLAPTLGYCEGYMRCSACKIVYSSFLWSYLNFGPISCSYKRIQFIPSAVSVVLKPNRLSSVMPNTFLISFSADAN